MEHQLGERKFSPKRLRKMRERAKMSQEAMAFAIDASQRAVSDWERGKHVPNEESLRAICKALGCTEEDLNE